jgi:hypothetical protein
MRHFSRFAWPPSDRKPCGMLCHLHLSKCIRSQCWCQLQRASAVLVGVLCFDLPAESGWVGLLFDSSQAAAFRLMYLTRQTHCTCFLLGPHAAVQTGHCRGYAASSAKAADVRCSRATYGSKTCFSALRACSTSPLAMADRGLAYDVHHHVRWHLHACGPLQHALPPVDDGKLLRIAQRLHCSCMCIDVVRAAADMSSAARRRTLSTPA